MAFVRKWAVLVGICVVALVQLSQVLAGNQSSWKGGGFGMYAGFHPNFAEIWAWPADGSEPVRYTRSARGPAYTSRGLRLCTVRTTRQCLESRMPRENGVPRYRHVELWQRSYDAESSTLTRTLLLSYPTETRPETTSEEPAATLGGPQQPAATPGGPLQPTAAPEATSAASDSSTAGPGAILGPPPSATDSGK